MSGTKIERPADPVAGTLDTGEPAVKAFGNASGQSRHDVAANAGMADARLADPLVGEGSARPVVVRRSKRRNLAGAGRDTGGRSRMSDRFPTETIIHFIRIGYDSVVEQEAPRMTDDERLREAMERLAATVDVLETLKNLTMADWLVAVLDDQDLLPLPPYTKAIGHG